MAKEPFVEKITTRWIGAAFIWLINGFKGKYLDYLDSKYEKRNLITGYVISLAFFISIVIFFLQSHKK